MKCPVLPGNFGAKGFLDQPSPLNLGLSLLYLGHDTINVLQLLAAVPENLGVLYDLFGRLSVDLLRDGVDVLSAVLLVQPNEQVEVSLRPIGEALLQQVVLLLDLVFGKLLRIVNLSLLFLLYLLRIGSKLGVEGHFVTHCLAVVVNLGIQKLK